MPLQVTRYNHCVQELEITDYWSLRDAKVSCMQSFLCIVVLMKGVSASLN